jgi:regulatory protein
MPIDAERWLASRGVTREPVVSDRPEVAPSEPVGPGAPGTPVGRAAPVPGGQETVGRSGRTAGDATRSGVPADGPEGVDEASVAARPDDVDAALAFVRRSTANAPQSEGRLRGKLADRGHDPVTVDMAMMRARDERLVDDEAILTALIIERRARGHADARLRRDLRDRGFTGAQVDEALIRHASTDPAAAAFAVARDQAARHRGVDAEVAVRRTVGALVRRGHGEALARKAARDAVYADREAQEVAGR